MESGCGPRALLCGPIEPTWQHLQDVYYIPVVGRAVGGATLYTRTYLAGARRPRPGLLRVYLSYVAVLPSVKSMPVPRRCACVRPALARRGENVYY